MQILLLTSRDKSLLSQATTQAMSEFLGDESKDAALSRFDEQNYLLTPETGPPRKDINVLVEAAQTPPMLASKRVVLARDLAFFGGAKAAYEPLLKYLANPSPDTAMILVWETSGTASQALPRLPQALSAAIRDAGGEVRDISPGRPSRRGPNDWFDQQLNKSGVRLSGRARDKVWDWLGDKHSSLAGLLETLAATYGTDRILEEDEVGQFLSQSEAGSIPIWNLTDAIDQGQRDVALGSLRRLLANGAYEPLQIVFSLHRHFEQMLRLDGLPDLSEAAVAKALGLPPKLKFKSKKIASQSMKLGSDKLARSLRFIAEADLDVRGRSGLDPEIVLEVLVARLASQVRWVS